MYNSFKIKIKKNSYVNVIGMNNSLSFNRDYWSWIGFECHYVLEAPYVRAVAENHHLA